jgi:queuine tRNA-ribosyltransferase
MGVGRPENILEAIERGIDIFDCAMPTRNARNSYLFTSEGVLAMRNSQYKDDFETIDKNCNCYTCSNFSRAYLRHLFIAKEILALELASIHNLHFYLNLVKEARRNIIEGSFLDWKSKIIKKITLDSLKPIKNGKNNTED